MSARNTSRRDDTKSAAGQKVRLDKWLWAARFYKTRSLASEAIKGGKVAVNGHRAKPSREVELGDSLTLRQGFDQKTVIVQALSDRRGPASVAQQLYTETAESITARERERELRQLANSQRPRGEGRPTKRERRHIHRFTRGSE
jgi:ribosome-associated heat shock protein Hsp15